MTLEQLSWHVDDVIKRRLQATKGVGRVERYGGVDREIRVNLDPEKLLAYGITAAQVNSQVRATNVDLGSGRGEVGGQEQAIRMLAGARQVSALADAKIILGGGREVRLKNLGRVVDDASEQRSFGRLNGQPVVSFSIFRMKGTSELSVADAVDKTLKELETKYPGCKADEDRRCRRLYARQLRCCHGSADRRRGARRPGRAPVPAQHARDADLGHCATAGCHPDVLGDERFRIFPEPRQPARHYARDWHSRRRRDRRDREYRAPYAHGQIAISCRSRGRRRDRLSRHRHHADDRCDLCAGFVHGRHRRTVLQAVRHDRCRRGALFAARRSPHHADDGGLPDAAHSGKSACRWRADALLYALSGGDPALALCNARQRRRAVLGCHLRDDAAADRLSSR